MTQATRKILTTLVINGYDDGLVGDDCSYVFNEPARSLYKQAYAVGNRARIQNASPPTDGSAHP